jgi:hypothetical protein
MIERDEGLIKDVLTSRLHIGIEERMTEDDDGKKKVLKSLERKGET